MQVPRRAEPDLERRNAEQALQGPAHSRMAPCAARFKFTSLQGQPCGSELATLREPGVRSRRRRVCGNRHFIKGLDVPTTSNALCSTPDPILHTRKTEAQGGGDLPRSHTGTRNRSGPGSGQTTRLRAPAPQCLWARSPVLSRRPRTESPSNPAKSADALSARTRGAAVPTAPIACLVAETHVSAVRLRND